MGLDPKVPPKEGGTTDPNTVSAVVANGKAVAVSGVNNGNGSFGLLAGPEPFGHAPVGVFGRSGSTGVFGFSDKAGGGVGIAGNTNAGTGTGVHGHTSTGVGVLGTCDRSDAGGLAGRFEGNVAATGELSVGGKVSVAGDLSIGGNVLGDIRCLGDIILLNQDLSEDFESAAERRPDPGTVMVIGPEGKLAECRQPYDRRVAGVVAGGGAFRPAIVLGRGAPGEERLPIALVGKVSCKVDARYAPIEVGDLLTTSPTPGHAMRAADGAKALGAVIGKALCPLGEGTAEIPILIALQ